MRQLFPLASWPFLPKQVASAVLFPSPLCLIHADEFTPEKEARFRSALSDLQLDSDAAIRFEPGEPAEGILKVQREESIDLLVAGAMETQTVHRNFTGDVARELLRRAPCDLLLYTEPKENPKPPEGILVVVPDLSERSRHILCAALSLAGRSGGRQITILHVQTTFAEAKEKALGVRQWRTLSGRNARILGTGPSAAERGAGLSSSPGKHRIYGVRVYPVERHRSSGHALANALFGSAGFRSRP